jgi:hypothetical protein
MTRWPSAITTHLWPYVLQKSIAVINLSIRNEETKTPTELFAGVEISPKLLHQHPFGCPEYVLVRKMQGMFKAPKWGSRVRLGIYIGILDHYASNVGLVLSLITGLVSPQFHLKFDDKFITVSAQLGTTSELQIKRGFMDKSNSKQSKNINIKGVASTTPTPKPKPPPPP